MTQTFLMFFLFLIFTSQAPLTGKVIHLLMAGDVGEDAVGRSVRVDLERIHDCFTYIAKSSNIPLQLKQIQGTSLRYENIELWIEDSKFSRDDVVVLYYSGHGGRTKISPTMWPFGWFYRDEKAEFSQLVDKILSKKPSLCLVLLDCCNNYSPRKKHQRTSTYFDVDLNRMDSKIIAEGTNRLFFQNYGLVISSAAVPGKAGHINQLKYESFFTSLFLNNLFKEMQTANPQWDNIFASTRRHCAHETKHNSRVLTHQWVQYKTFLYKEKMCSEICRKDLSENCKFTKIKSPKSLERQSCFCSAKSD